MDPALAVEVAAIARQRALNETIQNGDSEMQCFYKNQVVFVTGGSGFLGKNLVEKILRACDVEKIYLLLRPKKGKQIQQRLNEILEDPVFEIVKKNKPNFCDKLVPIEGDICELDLGIRPGDWKKLSEEVNIIFHVAATVKFDEPLKTATITNVRGTQQLLRLGKDCRQLKSLVYVSTLYSHATKARLNQEVVEQFYDSPVPPAAITEMVQHTDETILNDITVELTKNWPNTYTFTKAIAEEAVRSLDGQIPLCIVRPSIVIGAYREPIPGWIDEGSVYGPSGLLLGTGLGVVHTVLCDDNIKVDLMPVDLVNNATMAAAWKTAERWKNNHRNIIIYNVSNSRNYTLWGEHLSKNLRKSRDIVSPKAVWYCSATNTNSQVLFTILSWLFHFIPAYVIDAAMYVAGKEPRFIKLYTKVFKMTTILSYFTSNQWEFRDKNVVALQKSMSPADKIIFDFDSENIEWADMFKIWYMGIRKYIIKDGLKNTDLGVKKQYWLKFCNYLVLALYGFIFYKLFFMFCSLLTYVF